MAPADEIPHHDAIPAMDGRVGHPPPKVACSASNLARIPCLPQSASVADAMTNISRDSTSIPNDCCGSDLTRSPRRRGMSAICALQPFRKHPA